MLSLHGVAGCTCLIWAVEGIKVDPKARDLTRATPSGFPKVVTVPLWPRAHSLFDVVKWDAIDLRFVEAFHWNISTNLGSIASYLTTPFKEWALGSATILRKPLRLGVALYEIHGLWVNLLRPKYVHLGHTFRNSINPGIASFHL